MKIKKMILSGMLACLMLGGLVGCSIIDEISKDNMEKVEDKTEGETTEDNINEKHEEDKLEEKELNVAMFIPNTNYEATYDASDGVSTESYIKGVGTAYQVIGTNGKGPFVNVYTTKDGGLFRSFSSDLTNEEFNDKENLDFLTKKDDIKENILLKGPIVVGTRWDTKEIVEVGENLKLDNMTLEGTYIKVWEKQKSNEGNEIVQVHYYSEGLGCVQYRILADGTVMEYSTLKSITKK